jgi:hypothetical protein
VDVDFEIVYAGSSLTRYPRRRRLRAASDAFACTEGAAMPTKDNESVPPGIPFSSSDTHGVAALLLVESLIHGLCEKGVLTAGEAVEITERALHVQFEKAEEEDGGGAPLLKSHDLLAAIAASLRIDDRSGGPSLHSV